MNKGSLTMFLERDFQQLTLIRKLHIVGTSFHDMAHTCLNIGCSSTTLLQLSSTVRDQYGVPCKANVKYSTLQGHSPR
jgi:hypothetical protein